MKQLSGFHYQRNLASKFTRTEPSGLLHLGKHSRSIAGIAQNRRYRRTQRNTANDSLTHDTIDRAVKIFKRMDASVVAKCIDTFTIHSNCSVVLLYYFTLNSIICSVIVCTFTSTPKSLGDFTVMLITLKR